MQYIVPSVAATSILHALKTDFHTSGQNELIISKGGSRLEFHALDPDGLRLIEEVPIYGTILSLVAFKLPDRTRSSLAILLASYRFFVLSFSDGKIITEASTDFTETTAARPADLLTTILIDPELRFLGIHAYNGLFRIVPLPVASSDGKKRRKSTTEKEELDLDRSYNIRLPDYNVASLVLLSINSIPTLCILHDDANGDKILRVRQILMNEKDFSEEDIQEFRIEDEGSDNLIGVNNEGVIVIGEARAVYIPLDAVAEEEVAKKGKGKRRASEISVTATSSTSPTSKGKRKRVEEKLPLEIYKAFVKIDEDEGQKDRYLLGDVHGLLHGLNLVRNQAAQVVGMEVSEIGQISSPMELVYLSNHFLFVASHYGDSQLVKLPSNSETMEFDTPSDNSIQLIDTFTNLAPISDFCVVESKIGGGTQIVTCSGAYNDGSLKIISNGVGMSELASLDVQGLQRVWSLRQPDSEHDEYLVISTVSDTQILSFANLEDGIEALDILPGLDTSLPTLHAFVLPSAGLMCQVTKKGVTTSDPAVQWISDKEVTLCATEGDLIVLASVGGQVDLIGLLDGHLKVIKSATLAQEISCLDVHVLPQNNKIAIAAGLWTTQEMVLLESTHSSDTLATRYTASLGTSFLLRSALITTFSDNISMLFVGVGDGSLITLTLEDSMNGLSIIEGSRKTAALGVKPIVLASFPVDGKVNVFVSSDRPTVVSRTNGRMNYASVALENITAVTPFHASAYENSLVMASSTEIRIGRIDEVHKVQIKTVKLEEHQPRRIAYSSTWSAYGVLCLKETYNRSTGKEERTSSFKIVKEDTFEVLLDFDFDEEEQGLSVAVLKVGEDEVESFVVGAATVLPTEIQAKRGRVLLWQQQESGFEQVTNYDARGSPYSIAQLPKGRVAITINSSLHVLEKTKADTFELLAKWGASFLATNVVTSEDRILVGDALRSVVALKLSEDSRSLFEVARENTSYGIMSLQALTEDKFIAADQDMNLFTMFRTPVAPNSKDMVLKPAGLFHLGEIVNRMQYGSLVPKFAQTASAGAKAHLLYATSSGTLGVIADLEAESGKLLSDVQRNMRRVLKGFGDVEQQDWRRFSTEFRSLESVGFIDGGFVERFSDLSATEIEEVLAGGNEAERILVSKEAVQSLLEECERLH